MTGIEQFVMRFEPGVALEDDAQWQAPAHCFPDDDDEEEEQGERNDHVASSSEEAVWDGLEATQEACRRCSNVLIVLVLSTRHIYTSISNVVPVKNIRYMLGDACVVCTSV